MKLKYCFTGLATSDMKYYIGTSSASVYIYDYVSQKLLSKHKDVAYANQIFLTNDEKYLVVKSSEPKIAIYELSTQKLKHKIRVKGTNQPQDANLCFSPCGKYIYNIVYDPDLHSYLIQINIESGEYSKIYALPYSVFTQILYVKEHKKYYLWGFERGVKNGYFCKVLDHKLKEKKHIRFPDYVSKVEYSPKESYFYLRYLAKNVVKAYNKDFSTIVKEIIVEPQMTTLKFGIKKKDICMSKYGLLGSFSLNKETLDLGLTYQKMVCIVDKDSNIKAEYPQEYGGYVKFSNVIDEVFVNNEIYKIT